MKTVIIPNDYHPFVIEVNGVKYTYPEGTEQSVPDEVASAIEHYYKLQPKERPADGGVLPWVSKENDGDVLKVEDGVWKPGEGGGGGDAGWKTFSWDTSLNRIDFEDAETREHYLATPEPFYVLKNGTDELILAVMANGGNRFTYTEGGNTYTLSVYAPYDPGVSYIELNSDLVSDWGYGSLRTLPLTAGTSHGDVLKISTDGVPVWGGASFPKVTITQEELGSKIMNIGAFTAQANDTVQMKTFSFTGTAGSSIAGKILGILESGAGFIEIQGFGVQALAYGMGPMAVRTTQTYGYFSDPTKPFLFSADYVINNSGEEISVDLNFYVQKVNVVS